MTIQEWLNNDQLGIDIWTKKYQYNNETLDAWFKRVSGGDAYIEQLIKDKKFLFGGRTLSNRGTNNGSYSNCYSIGYVEDSLSAIMDAAKDIAMTFKAQGGQGLSLSKIRPKGSLIGGKFKSDGIVPFMEIFNTVTEGVSQGGSRKGALLMSLDINHPEARAFMTIKSDLNKINKANLSVEIDDEFMQKVLSNDYDATSLFDLLCVQACKYAEPGVIFTNRFRNYNLMEFVSSYEIETCNPCGEQPLAKHSACNLSSINLSEYVLNPFTSNVAFDYESLRNDIPHIVKAMDDIITENLPNHALEIQRLQVQKFRNLGIGYMGIHDLFIKFGYIYGDENSFNLISKISKFIFRESVKASVSLAKIRGNFEGYDPKIWDSAIIHTSFTEEEINIFKQENCLRNCSLISIAPTGSIGTMLNVSTGIEPWFATHYTRNTKSLNGQETSYEVWAPVISISKEKDWHPETWITSNDIPSDKRLVIQAAVQTYCDTAISSTLNLNKNTTSEDIKHIYIQAWKLGLKGCTVYVDGSRSPILTTSNSQIINCPKRPEILPAKLIRFKNNNEKWIAFIGLLDGKPYEIFTGINNLEEFPVPSNIDSGEIIKIKESGEKRYDFVYIDSYGYKNRLGGLSRIFNKEYWNYAKLISALLRGGIELDKVIKIIDGLNLDSDTLNTWKNGVKRALKSFIEDGTISSEKCPECGNNLIYTGGCNGCPSCGFSKCG